MAQAAVTATEFCGVKVVSTHNLTLSQSVFTQVSAIQCVSIFEFY